MENCIFCQIIKKEIPSKIVYEDDKIIAFYDLSPMAPVHVLVVPKEHIACCDEINSENCEVIGYLFSKIPEIAKSLGLDNGYRVVNNCKEEGCQSVMHLHFHLLGGKQLSGEMA